eukprot:1658627-Amphidinium_carterae.1
MQASSRGRRERITLWSICLWTSGWVLLHSLQDVEVTVPPNYRPRGGLYHLVGHKGLEGVTIHDAEREVERPC